MARCCRRRRCCLLPHSDHLESAAIIAMLMCVIIDTRAANFERSALNNLLWTSVISCIFCPASTLAPSHNQTNELIASCAFIGRAIRRSDPQRQRRRDGRVPERQPGAELRFRHLKHSNGNRPSSMLERRRLQRVHLVSARCVFAV